MKRVRNYPISILPVHIYDTNKYSGITINIGETFMSETEKTPETQVETTAPAGAPETAPGKGIELTIQDLAGLKTVIDVATTRGAFKANEMLSVGTVYNKLEAFLNAVSQNQPKEPSEGAK